MQPRAVLAVISAAVITLVISGVALADSFHGAAVAKSTTGPAKIGDPYVSAAQFRNIADEDMDILRVTGLSDTVFAASGDVSQDLTGTGLIFNTQVFGALPAGTITCNGTGAGTAGDPHVGWTECLLDFNTGITTVDFTFYTVESGDYNLTDHKLENQIAWAWNNTCQPGTQNCTTDPQSATAAAAAVVLKRDSATVTDIHNAAHQVVLTVAVGTTVHDLVSVSSTDGGPIPTGNVNIDWFLNGTCAGAPAANSGSVGPLNGSGQFDATGFAFTVNSAGMRSFQAHYEGSDTYNTSDGACEPLQVVDANIQITPDGVNRVGETHTFTAHVNVNDGSGFANAPNGTQISFTIDSGPGSFTSSNPCTTSGGTGSCTIDLSSAVTGVTTVSAHTTVSVGGVSLARDTNGTGANSGPATKTWVNARISITPNAFNEVTDPHTFTATLEFDTGNGAGFVPAAGQSVTIALTNSNGASANPAGPFINDTNASGQTTATFTSSSAGTVTGHASWTGSVAGSGTFSVSTDGQAPNSGDATKVFQNARISITPDGLNPVNTTHTFTATVEVDYGQGAGWQLAPAGTQITFTIDSDTAASLPNPPASCLTIGTTGACTTTITSAVTGTTVVSAHVTFTTPNAVTLTRSTDGTGGSSGPATKQWFQLPTPTPTSTPTPTPTPSPTLPDTAPATGPRAPGSGSSGLTESLLLGLLVAALLVARPIARRRAATVNRQARD